MKRKQIMGLVLALTVALAGFAGCGGKGDVNPSEASAPSSGTEAVSAEGGQSAGAEGGAGTESGVETGAEGSSVSSEAPGAGEAAPAVAEVPILKDAVMKTMNCRIGAAATGSEMDDPKVWEIITTHFNALTLGNELKPDCMFGYSNGRCPGTEAAELNGETIVVPKLDYSRAERLLDKIYDWNQANPDNKIMVRGHVLVWHSQTPEWFFHVDYDKNKEYADKETMNKRLEWYIRTMLTHFTGEESKYKDMFYGWDVVNEAISDNPERVYRNDAENPNEQLSQDTHGSNSSWWHVYQSNEFIINAFIYANKYAPASLELYYNDYNECGFQKSEGIVELLTELKEKEGEPGVGTRISAMGMQGHYDMTNPDMYEISKIIQKYAKVVGNVQLTEVDIKASADYDGSDEAKEKEFKNMAGRYKAIYWSMKNARDKGANITGITFWGTVDHYSWLQSRSNVGGGANGNLPQCPLLFDEHYEPKPSFYVFAERE